MVNKVSVNIKTKYLTSRSYPEKFYFLFSYQVSITNEGLDPVRLISRYWNIVYGDGNTEDIHGPGVIGEQPWIKAGDKYEYTSYCPLKTPIGKMGGAFQMINKAGDVFDVNIEHFELAANKMLN